MDQIQAMQIFLHVAELGSFTQTAQNMNVPKSAVSQAISQLEQELATRLLHRTTRKVQLTQDGQVYYARCRDILAELQELQGLFQQDGMVMQGRIRVDLPLALAQNCIWPHLPEFTARYPRIDLELSSTDRFVDVVQEGFDCVVRVGALASSSLIARPLGALPQVNCLSAAYVAAHGAPTQMADLVHHQLVHYAQRLGEKRTGFEYLDPVDHQLKQVPMSGRITVNNSQAYQAACLAGYGLIQVPIHGVQSLLEAEDLVSVLPDYQAPDLPVSLVYANRRYQPQRVVVFMDWLANEVRHYLSALTQV